MPHSGHHMMGPLGVLSPTPGVSYLFHGNETSHTADGDGSLWGIANGPHMASGLPIGGMMSPPASWSPTLGDMVIKIDSKLKVRSLDLWIYVLSLISSVSENHCFTAERAWSVRSQRNQRRAGIARPITSKSSAPWRCTRTIWLRRANMKVRFFFVLWVYRWTLCIACSVYCYNLLIGMYYRRRHNLTTTLCIIESSNIFFQIRISDTCGTAAACPRSASRRVLVLVLTSLLRSMHTPVDFLNVRWNNLSRNFQGS